MLKKSFKTYKVIVCPILQYCSAIYPHVRMHVCMYVRMYVSFLMIKSDVFVSAPKIDGDIKNKLLKIHNKNLHY